MSASDDRPPGMDIAVIGMAGRFSGAANVQQFWANLVKGRECITFVDDARLPGASARAVDSAYVPAWAGLEGADTFDASFFGYAPREAELLDPQHRVFLECAWTALEDAGHDPERFSGSIGVYASAGINVYLLENLLPNDSLVRREGNFALLIASDKDTLSTRVGYKLNLSGPCMNIQTTCSSSLVGVHCAVLALLDYECDIALVGGVAVKKPVPRGYRYSPGGIVSPDGHCRPFDARAQGTVVGDGVGVVVLRRLSDALADRDHVRAVIKGSAVNNDGADKMSYTAPGLKGQSAVIKRALAIANLDPASVGYVEGHGTGTLLGDPIEVAALNHAYGNQRGRASCALGSVKGNIGHLDTAAGIVGLIKTVSILQHGKIPPTVHFERPNPEIDFEGGPFFVNPKVLDWPASETPRRAGVSSFGIGGTNAHVILEEAPVAEAGSPSRPVQLVSLAARSASALDAMTRQLSLHLGEGEVSLPDVCYTQHVGRRGFAFRRIAVARSSSEAGKRLESLEPGAVFTGTVGKRAPGIAFVFPGQGSQAKGIAAGIYQHEPVFRRHFDECCSIANPLLGLDLKNALYPAAGEESRAPSLDETYVAQPALFVLEYSLARLWMEWGVKPQALLGLSIGEYVAACIADVFSPEDALRLLVARGRLMQDLPRGAMLSVGLPEAKVTALLGDGLELAVVSTAESSVVSGPHERIAELEARLLQQRVAHLRLQTSHAFHSFMMEPILHEFTRLVESIPRQPPRIRFLSNVTGSWITDQEATDPGYWARQLRQTVRFHDCVTLLAQDQTRIVLEVGPASLQLGTIGRSEGSRDRCLASLPRSIDPTSQCEHLLATLGRLWVAGVVIDWEAYHRNEQRRRVSLPTYSFERERYWVKPRKEAIGTTSEALAKSAEVDDWLYVPRWRRALPDENLPAGEPSERWLFMLDERGVGAALASELRVRGTRVATIAKRRSADHAETEYGVDGVGDRLGLLRTLEVLKSGQALPDRIVYLWALDEGAAEDEAALVEALRNGLCGMALLIQALAEIKHLRPMELCLVAGPIHDVVGTEQLRAARATTLAGLKVLTREYPHITCRCIDIVPPQPGDQSLMKLLLEELLRHDAEPITALRGRNRWTPSFERPRTARVLAHGALRVGGTYLITGGLGRAGRLLANQLARAARAKIVLVDRPERALGAGLQSAAAIPPEIAVPIEALGGQVFVAGADVTDAAEFQGVVSEVRDRVGPIHGVIHSVSCDEPLLAMSELDVGACVPSVVARWRGLIALRDAFDGTELDFCILMSSLASVLGGLGHATYTASHLLMDAFAHATAHASAMRWMSVNWETWKLGQEQHAFAGLGNERDALALNAGEMGEAFMSVLAMRGEPQVAVSTANLESRMTKWLRHATPSRDGSAEESGQLHPRPASAGHYEPPRSELERRLVDVWQALLGIDHVGVLDSFLQLGGDSLRATQLISQVRQLFQVDVPLRGFLEKPTVENLAGLVMAAQLHSGDTSQVETLLNQVEKLGHEDAEALLDRRAEIGTGPGGVDHRIVRVTNDGPDRFQPSTAPASGIERPMKFSVFFFSGDGSSVSPDKYRLLLDAARLADQRDFTAIWTPERHFNEFGGLYPNPAVLGAALAMSTRRLQIRAGSVVLPLNDPLRVVEQWAVVDNLSGGRVAVSFASGWHPDDFVLAPGAFSDRRQKTIEGIAMVQRLWAGEQVELVGGKGTPVNVRAYPRPLQAKLPIWLTASGNPQTWITAGTLGLNVLTGLMEQSVKEVEQRIGLYREALRKNGHDADSHEVTLMMHTFVSGDQQAASSVVRPHLTRYLKTHLGLYERLAEAQDMKIDPSKLTEDDKDALVAFGVERYIGTSSLIGSMASCQKTIDRMKAIGVTEIACLVDFGVKLELVLESLQRVADLSDARSRAVAASG